MTLNDPKNGVHEKNEASFIENSKESPKPISQLSETPKTPIKAPEVMNEVPENDDSNEIMVINLRQSYSFEIIIIRILRIPIWSLSRISYSE